jgi:ABC-type taurine transport system substrate-binding protein
MKQMMVVGLMLLALPAAARDIDADSGLVIAPGFTETKQNCTVCHSAKLITQSRADRDGWLSMIRWMQKTQKFVAAGPQRASDSRLSRRKLRAGVHWSSTESAGQVDAAGVIR